MAEELGYVTLPVIPSFRGASTALSRELSTSGIGTKVGMSTGTDFGRGFSRTVKTEGVKGTNDLFDTAAKGATAAGLGIGKRMGVGIRSSISEYAKFAAASVAGYFAVDKVRQVVTESITQASDLAESANKIEVTFGGASDAVFKFASTAATSLGQSELEARDAAATFGVFGKSAGLSGDELVGFSTKLDSLAGDLASFYNTSPQQAIEAIGSGLRGEAEPLRQYGVLLQDATLRQEAMREGLIKTTTQALTPAQKVLAAYHVILDQTSDAQGDFERTSGGLANQQRIASAEWKNLEASIGSVLLPTLTKLMTFTTTTVLPGVVTLGHDVGVLSGFIGDLPDPIKAVAVALAAMAAAEKLAGGSAMLGLIGNGRALSARGGVLDGIRARGMYAADALKAIDTRSAALRGGAGLAGVALLMADLGDDTTTAGVALRDFSTIAGDAAIGFSVGGPWGAAIGTAAGLFQAVTASSGPATSSVDSFTDTLDENTGALTRNSRELVFNDLQKNGTYDAARTAGISLDLVTDAALGQADAIAALNRIYEDVTPLTTAQSAYIATGKATHGAALDANALREQQDPLAVAIDTVRKAVGAETDTIAGARQEWRNHQEVLGGNVKALDAARVSTSRMSKVGAQLGEDLGVEATETGKLTGKQRENTTATKLETLAHRALNDVLAGRLSSLAGLTLAITQGVTASKDLDGATTSNHRHIAITTEAGANLANTLADIATSAAGVTGGAKIEQAALDRARAAIIRIGTEAGLSDTAARRYADGLLTQADAADKVTKTPATTKVSAEGVDTALGDIKRFASGAETALHGIPDEPVTVTMSAQANKVLQQLGGVGAFAGGGGVEYGRPLYGPGSGTSDSFLARVSNGERVAREATVTRAGRGNNRRGQAVFEAFERMIDRGELGKFGDLQPFATGGEVAVRPLASSLGLPGAVGALAGLVDAVGNAVGSRVSSRLSDRLTHLPTGGQLGPGGSLTPAQLVRGQNAAASQVGKPYIWGGVGPDGYDCSGFQSYVLNSAMGFGNPYFRRGSTGTMPWPGSAPGLGRYSIGWTTNWDGSGIGHTSGNIGGLNVESYGGHGPAVGAGARTPLDPHFYGRMHYALGGPVQVADQGGWLSPGWNHVFNGTGRPEEIPPPNRPAGGYTDREVVHLLGKVVARLDTLAATIAREEGATRDTILPGMADVADSRIRRRGAYQATRARSRR